MTGLNRVHTARVLDARESFQSPPSTYRKPVLAEPKPQRNYWFAAFWLSYLALGTWFVAWFVGWIR